MSNEKNLETSQDTKQTEALLEKIQAEEAVIEAEVEEGQNLTDAEQIDAMEEAEAKLTAAQQDVSFVADKSPIAGVSQSDFNRLTSKSQQFMVNLDRHLIEELDYEVRRIAYMEMVETLLNGQQTGQTARQIYGTPTEVAQSIIDQELSPPSKDGDKSPDWQIYVDGALLLGSIFTFLTGFSMANAEGEITQYFGVITMIINYLVAGFSMLVTAKNMPNPDAPKGKKGYPKYFLASIGSMVLWFIAVSASGALLPQSINVMLPHTWYMIIAAITFAGRIFFKRYYNVKGGIF